MKRLPGLLLLLLPLLAASEVVVPIASVEDHVNVRMSPDASSEIVGRLYQGDSMPLVESMTDWHEVDISGGATGFISADWVDVLDKAPELVEADPVSMQFIEDNGDISEGAAVTTGDSELVQGPEELTDAEEEAPHIGQVTDGNLYIEQRNRLAKTER